MLERATKQKLKEHVRAPIREGHLLDLFLSSSPGVTAVVLPKLADHAVVLAKFPCSFSRPVQVYRERYGITSAQDGHNCIGS